LSQIDELEQLLSVKEHKKLLGITDQEIKVYTTLLLKGPLLASEICDVTSIPKVSIYQTINSLKEKKFLDEQPVSRGSKYKAVHPSLVMDELQRALDERQSSEQKLFQDLATRASKFKFKEAELVSNIPSDSVWLIDSEARIQKIITDLLEKSKISIIVCLPTIDAPAYTKTREEILSLLEKIMKKKKNKMELLLSWELETGTNDEVIANNLTKYGGNVYQWGLGELPFAAFLIDDSEGMIVLQSAIEPTPKFGLAIWISHPTYVKPFKELIKRFNEAGAFKKWG
jgi:sugar-specific transcriptional regulator TrmB